MPKLLSGMTSDISATVQGDSDPQFEKNYRKTLSSSFQQKVFQCHFRKLSGQSLYKIKTNYLSLEMSENTH
jgi:hypothetical protein